MIKIGDIVSRYKYNNDCLFKVVDIKDDIYYLSGLNIRLCASTNIDDLKLEDNVREDDSDIVNNIRDNYENFRDDFFFIPGKILHIDADKEYLNRCLKFYKELGINAYGIYSEEEDLYKKITKYLNDIKPDIVIITGHDAFNKNNNIYKNSDSFVKAIYKSREYEKSYDKLKIIAGACQSNYEELIKAGATFASSPKRVNIHALDPAIIASSLALTENTKEIDLIETLNKTKCKSDGIGGLKTYGCMIVGYPKEK